MDLLWINPATKNKFANKHLHVVTQSMSSTALYQVGKTIFDGRINACRTLAASGLSQPERAALRAQYGETKPPVNTLLVFSIGGFKELVSAIMQNGCQSGSYKIANGYIFTASDTLREEGFGGTVELDIRPADGGKHEVYHLKGATVGSKLAVSATALNQLHIQSFVPSTSDLASAKRNLRSEDDISLKWLFG